MIKTIQMTIDEDLLTRLDNVVKKQGIARSAYIRQAIERALTRQKIAELERRHIQGYQRFPVKPGEFDIWESEQAWGDK